MFRIPKKITFYMIISNWWFQLNFWILCFSAHKWSHDRGAALVWVCDIDHHRQHSDTSPQLRDFLCWEKSIPFYSYLPKAVCSNIKIKFIHTLLWGKNTVCLYPRAACWLFLTNCFFWMKVVPIPYSSHWQFDPSTNAYLHLCKLGTVTHIPVVAVCVLTFC